MKELLAGYETLSSLEKIYTASLVIGIIVPILDLIMGVLSIGLHMGTDIDFDFDADMNFASTWLPLSSLAILSFLVLFGGGGLISLFFVSEKISLLIAIAAGYFFAVVMNKFVIIPLKRNRVSSPKAEEIIGKSARVTSSIIESGFGEIVVIVDRITLNYTAASKDNEAIGYGETVQILELKENGVAIVCKEKKGEF
ncbi:hypothetical protein [Anaerotignum propionicum]|uniref:Membrane protein NfeD2 N-terminal transmembrane domain-containing protein n=1 Tax=Anaerotignum propionicum DSM 1682 TaxID=991789 RepID=A0A0X1U701_ANAPI|nr:hypothetical protein [Anaerotignum propionicum]AMJ40711.1 hypothetical protein CPRO_11160 [Anaerotignum propionicum DSM 1682]MEA5057878.1 hypothetical protein [Anaerotignum propionicum]SHF07880.1 hypothetical protein SAMN02745151_02701 [[Clostridium] propionicum DSM 1682] [Anaerotignum propionicum DSM 1682]